MHRAELPTRKRAGLPLYLSAVLLLLAVLALPGAARAQWTTTGSNTTTTSNVGVGTTNPVTPVEARGTGSFGGDVLSGAGGLASPFGGVGRIQNLLPNSETVGGTGWAIQLSASATQNATTAPDGNSTATKLACGNTNSSAAYVTMGASSGGTYTFSFWAKAGNSSRIQYGIFDLTTTTWVTFMTVTDLDSNWRRLVATGTPAPAHTFQVYIYPDTASGTVTNFNYVWGAQLTDSASPGVYARTAGSSVGAFNGAVVYGSVGVGTSAPTTRLTVTDGVAPFAAGATDLLQLKRGTTNGADNGGTSILFANASNGFRIKYGGTTDRLSFLDGGSVEVLSLANGGNVGVGAASPSYKLDVAGQVRSSSGGFVFPDGTTQATALSYGSTAGTAVQGNTTLTLTAGAGMSGGGAATLGAGGTLTLTNADRGSSQNIFKNVANSAGVTQFSAGSNNDSLLFEGTGGTTVSFNAAARKVTINSSASGSSGWTDGGSSVSLTNGSANVGVGVTNPSARLQVVGANGPADNTASPAPTAFSVTGGTGGNGTWGASAGGAGGDISLTGGVGGVPIAGGSAATGGAGGVVTITGGTGGTSAYAASGSGGNVVINGGASGGSAPAGASGNVVLANLRGSVGVGTTPNSSYKLDVSGNANVTGNLTIAGAGAGNITASGTITGGNIQATYQDVAEWVPSSQKLSAGTVVVLDTNKTNHVLASTKAYDTGVAGVVSDSPGVILGQAGGDKVKVATTGRVKVRVDATRAPIKVGDLLVTSGVEGVAMKSVPVDLGGVQIHRPGTIIGKALEPLEKGTGEILVLLSLQ